MIAEVPLHDINFDMHVLILVLGHAIESLWLIKLLSNYRMQC